MRVSSATRPSSSGTLRSARTRTRLSATSASRADRGSLITSRDWRGRERLRHPLDEIDEPARVAPFVVVPAEDLDEPPVHHRQLAVERAGVRRADDVGGDERFVRELEEPLERTARGGCPKRFVHLVLRRLAAEDHNQVD